MLNYFKKLVFWNNREKVKVNIGGVTYEYTRRVPKRESITPDIQQILDNHAKMVVSDSEVTTKFMNEKVGNDLSEMVDIINFRIAILQAIQDRDTFYRGKDLKYWREYLNMYLAYKSSVIKFMEVINK